MSVISPQAMLLWATLSSTLLLFLVQHLYRYDRFQCLKWRSSSDGGFKRFMTFSYIVSVPLLVVYSVAMAVMKYQAGYKAFPNPASTPSNPLPRIIVATPTEMWPQAHQNLVFPLYVIFAVAWALEIVSHLEELCFWLFMIKEQGGEGEGGVRPWFRSFEYKLWCCGSVGALVALPLVTIEARHDVQQVEAWTFFAGSVCSLIITLWFIQVLWKFPAFLKRIQAEDAEPEVIVRLMAFQDLNRMRVVFRLMFVLPLLVLACDGLKEDGPHVIIKTAGAADILAMVGGIGCVVSSVITLLVFFPRSIARESGYATRARTHTSQMQSKSGAGPVTKSNPHSKPPRQTTNLAPPQQPLSPGSSQFQSINGITSQLRSPSGVGELRSHGSVAVQRPPPIHRRTTSNSGPTPVAGGDPLTSAVLAQQPPALRIPRRPYASPATPDDAPGAGVQVTIHTTTRGDSQYFERPGGTVVLGDEELPSYIGDGLANSKLSRPRNHSGSSGTSEGGEGREVEASQGDYFAASGASVIRLGSISGVPLVRGSGSHGRERERMGLHPLLVNYTSPIDLHVEDDARIGRAM